MSTCLFTPVRAWRRLAESWERPIPGEGRAVLTIYLLVLIGMIWGWSSALIVLGVAGGLCLFVAAFLAAGRAQASAEVRRRLQLKPEPNSTHIRPVEIRDGLGNSPSISVVEQAARSRLSRSTPTGNHDWHTPLFQPSVRRAENEWLSVTAANRDDRYITIQIKLPKPHRLAPPPRRASCSLFDLALGAMIGVAVFGGGEE